MIYFIQNFSQNKNIKIDYYFFSKPEELHCAFIQGKIDSKIFKASLMNQSSVVITPEYKKVVLYNDEDLMILNENQIYLSYRLKNLLDPSLEFYDFSSILSEIGKFKAKKNII